MSAGGAKRVVARYRLPGAIDLIVHRTRRFKTTLVNVVFHRPLDEDTSASALLPYVLRRGTRTFPDMVAIARHLEKLFGASLDVDVLRFGERQALSFRLDVVDDRYLFMGGRDLFRQGMRLMTEMLTDPHLVGGTFSEEVFEQERVNLRRFVEGIKNDRGRYALDRCVRHMCAGEPYARSVYGEAEEIGSLDVADVHRVWRDLLERAPMDIYVVGSHDPEDVREVMEELLGEVRSGKGVEQAMPAVRRRPRRIRRLRERGDVVQARLVMGFRTTVEQGGSDSVPFAVWNTIFGSGSFSRLFREVRERRSLAYYCSASADLAKGAVFVQAGIDGAAASRVERLVRREMGQIERGRIDLSELRAAKAHLEASLWSSMDSPSLIAGFLQEGKMAGSTADLKDLLAAIARVRRPDVSRAALTVRPDTYYLLSRGAP